jgi:hypothetical protein
MIVPDFMIRSFRGEAASRPEKNPLFHLAPSETLGADTSRLRLR